MSASDRFYCIYSFPIRRLSRVHNTINRMDRRITKWYIHPRFRTYRHSVSSFFTLNDYLRKTFRVDKFLINYHSSLSKIKRAIWGIILKSLKSVIIDLSPMRVLSRVHDTINWIDRRNKKWYIHLSFGAYHKSGSSFLTFNDCLKKTFRVWYLIWKFWLITFLLYQ